MAQVIKDVVTWLKQWFYDKDYIDDVETGLQSQINNKADSTTVSSLATTVNGKADSGHNHSGTYVDGATSKNTTDGSAISEIKANSTVKGTIYHPKVNSSALTGVPTANTTIGSASTFTVSQPSVNTDGHVTALTTRTYTLPTGSTSQKGILQLGTGSGNAAAGNHTHSFANLTSKAHTDATASNIGQATGSVFGHTKLSDSYTSSGGAASTGIAASSKAVYDAYTALNSKINDLIDVGFGVELINEFGVDDIVNYMGDSKGYSFYDFCTTIQGRTLEINTIYLVYDEDADEYFEYILIPENEMLGIPETCEKLGTTGLENINLGNYVQKSSTAGLLKNNGDVMTGGTGSGNYAIGNHNHSGTYVDTVSDTLSSAGTVLGKIKANTTVKGTISHPKPLSSAVSSGLYKIAANTDGHITSATAVAKADITGLGISASDHTHSAYVNPTIADNLTTDSSTQVLSAKQGKILNEKTTHATRSLDSNTDLNTITDAGWYESHLNATTQTMSNTPWQTAPPSSGTGAGVAFAMEVLKMYGCWQIIYPYNQDDIWVRRNQNENNAISGWKTWYKIYNSKNIPTASTSQAGIVQLGTGASNAATGNHSHSAYVNPTIADNLTTNNASQVLSAKQGYILNNQDVEYVEGTHGTTATGSWTGTCSRLRTIQKNSTILFRMTSAGSGNASLTLTLADGSTFGPKEVWYNANARFTTHLPQHSVLNLIYDGTKWINTGIQNTNNYDRTYACTKVKNGESSQINAYTLIYGKNDGKYYKLAANGVLDVRFQILYLNGNLAADGSSYNVYTFLSGINIQNTISGITRVANEALYIEGTAFSSGQFTISSNVLVSESAVASGKYYIPIGAMENTTSLRFTGGIPTVFYHNGTKLVPVEDSKYATTSHTHPDTQLNWNGSTTSNSVSPLLMATGEEWNANRLAYFPPENIIIETSTDGGSTWTTQGTSAFSNVNRTKLVTTGSSTVYCGMGSTTDYSKNQLRITLDMGNVGENSVLYMVTRKIALYTASSNASGFKAQLSTQTYAQYSTNQNTFTNVGSAFDLVGWSGWNTAPINVTLGGYSGSQTNSSSDRIKRLRITFTQTGGTGNGGITKIRLYGETAYTVPSQLGINGHMYTYDESKNVTFPAKIIKSGGTTSQFLKANGDVDSNVYIHTAGTNLSKSNNTLNHATSGVGAKSSGLYKTTIDAQGHITAATAVAKADITGLGISASDHNHNATATPLVDSYTGTVGTSTLYARQDHIHPVINSTCPNGNNTDWYLKIMTVKVTGTYMDKVIAFDVIARRPRLHHVEISFLNQGDTDPQVRKLVVSGGDSRFWVAKSGTSTWDIYVKKQELYDGVNITHLQYGNGFNITFPNTVHTSLPTANILEALYERDNIGINLLKGTKDFSGCTTSAQNGNTPLITTESELYNGCVVKKITNTSSFYQDLGWDIPKEWLELGGIYTLSFWAKTDATHGYVNTYFYQSNITAKRLKSNGIIGSWTEGSFGDGATQFYPNQGWQRYYVTYQLLDSGTFNSNKKIIIRLLSTSGSGQNLYIAGFKLEKGDQATKYSESPLDAKTTISQSLCTDANGNITTEAKNNHTHSYAASSHTHGNLTSSGTVTTTDTSNFTYFAGIGASNNNLYKASKLHNSQVIDSTSANYGNMGLSANNKTQREINTAINNVLGTILSGGIQSVSTSDSSNFVMSIDDEVHGGQSGIDGANAFSGQVALYKIVGLGLVLAKIHVVSTDTLGSTYQSVLGLTKIPTDYRPNSDRGENIVVFPARFNGDTQAALTLRVGSDGSMDIRSNKSISYINSYTHMFWFTN